MTYDLLKAGLQLLGTDEAKQAIAEIDELMQLDTDREIWHNECFIVPAFAADELMVETTYDIYDKLYWANKDHTVSFDDYNAAVRKQTLGPSTVSNSMMQLGYEIVADLYADNQSMTTDALLHSNLTYELGKLLMDAATDHIAPNAVAEIAYDKLLAANIDETTASNLADQMQDLAQFIEPPTED